MFCTFNVNMYVILKLNVLVRMLEVSKKLEESADKGDLLDLILNYANSLDKQSLED